MFYLYIGLIIFVVILTLSKIIRGKKISKGGNYSPASDMYSGRMNSYNKEYPPAETTRQSAYEEITKE